MNSDLGTKLLADYESGAISRRQLVSRLMGLGAALATLESVGRAQDTTAEPETPVERPTFQATGLHHIALDVTDVPRSRDFYMRHLGLRVIRGDDRAMFLGADRDFFLTLFRAETPALNHYCYGIENYNPDAAEASLRAAGLEPRRTGGRVYFPDPDGLTVQVAGGR
jgi:catechol 2,3-dioxygenase-like lactoylglutathione lyase family enzyme